MTELICIYNIDNDTAEFEHKIHLQKALLTLSKNSDYLHFPRRFSLLIHSIIIYSLYISAASYSIHHHLPTDNKSDTDTTIGSRVRMKYAEPHT